MSGPSSSGESYFMPGGWRRCSAASLRGHIATGHLSPVTLDGSGVPLFDIGVAKYRGIGLGWVVSQAIRRLTLTDEQIRAQITGEWEVDSDLYRLRVAKTIKYIDEQGLAVVPWYVVDRIRPGSSNVGINLEQDVSFAERLAAEKAGINDVSTPPRPEDCLVNVAPTLAIAS